VIVRISTEDQYELDDSHAERLNELDNDLVAVVEGADETRFRELFDQMLKLVRDNGTVLADDDLRDSDVILPPPDLTVAQAAEEFTGDGLIPG
jgi:hypothetical protein